MRILVTGAAGFIGMHVAERLLARGDEVVGFDNLNDYYDVTLKQARLARLATHPGYSHLHADLADRAACERLFSGDRFDAVVHLAAQAGVRYAAENPHVYVASNVTGFLHVLEGCRRQKVGHLVFASTSSVYGANTRMPFSEHQPTEHPLTLYAATKKANEAMAHSYAHLFDIPCTGLRFFTVYGPWGRPDMSPFLFARAILAGEPLKVFNHGRHRRSFTYIDDIVDGVVAAVDSPAERDAAWIGDAPDPATSSAPYRLFNIGGRDSVDLFRYIEIMANAIGREPVLEMLPLQAGDVPDSHADTSAIEKALHCSPRVALEQGIPRFIEWYRGYYGV